MLQWKCPKRNQYPRRIAPRHPGNRVAGDDAGIAVVVDGAAPHQSFQWRSNRRRLNHWRRKLRHP